jgi:hypothetical protein
MVKVNATHNMVLAKAGCRHQVEWNTKLCPPSPILPRCMPFAGYMPIKSSSGFQIIKKEIEFTLREFGFKFYGSSSLFRLTQSDLLQFLYFQKGVSSLNEKCTINVVQQGLFVPGCSFDVLQPGGRIGAFTQEARDKWWHCNTSEAAFIALPDIKAMILNGVIPFFDLGVEETKLLDIIDNDQYNFIWGNDPTFVDKGYFYLKCGQYDKAMNTFKLKPSRVNKFKTIKTYVENKDFDQIQHLLKENVHHAKSRLKF